MPITRIIIVIAATLVGLGLVILGWLTPPIWGTYLPAVELQIGSALLLVPAIVWLERQFAIRVESLRSSLLGDVRAVEAAENIQLDSTWEDVFPAFHRFRLTVHKTVLVVPATGSNIWIGFWLFDGFQSGVNCSYVSLYLTDPGPDTSDLGAYVAWVEGTPLSRVLDQAAAAARGGSLSSQAVQFDRASVADGLRRALTGGVVP